MGTNKEKTPSAAMKKLLLQSASKKEQEIQQIGSVAENAATQLPAEKSEEVEETAPVIETVLEAGTDGNRISRTGKQKNGRRQREWEKILGISGRA